VANGDVAPPLNPKELEIFIKPSCHFAEFAQNLTPRRKVAKKKKLTLRALATLR